MEDNLCQFFPFDFTYFDPQIRDLVFNWYSTQFHHTIRHVKGNNSHLLIFIIKPETDENISKCCIYFFVPY